MAERDAEELIQRELDGTLTDVEKERLDRILRSDPGVRALRDHLAGVDAALRALPSEEPPPAIRERVRARVSARPHGERDGRARAARPRPGPVARLVAGLAERFRLQPAYPFALGVVAGALLLLPLLARLGGPGTVDGPDVAGALFDDRAQPSFEEVDRSHFDAGGVRGTLATRRSGATVMVELVVVSTRRPVSLELRYDPGQVVFDGIASLRKPTSHLSVNDGLVRVDHAGENLYRLAFTDTAGSDSHVELSIVSDRVLWKGSVRTGR